MWYLSGGGWVRGDQDSVHEKTVWYLSGGDWVRGQSDMLYEPQSPPRTGD